MQKEPDWAKKRVHILAAIWLLNVPSLFSTIPLASVIRVNLGWKQQAWLPHLIWTYSRIGKRNQQNKKLCLQTFKKRIKGSLRMRREVQTPSMMSMARKKKEPWRQASGFSLGVLTNGWLNTKCKSHSWWMDCNPELSPHMHPCFPSWMPWTLSTESHTFVTPSTCNGFILCDMTQLQEKGAASHSPHAVPQHTLSPVATA